MNISEILTIEGITIRLIPMQTTSLYAFREGKALRTGEKVIERNGRKFIQEVRENSLGGKYLVTKVNGQGSNVQFNLKYDGIGDSIESAYIDFLSKKG